MQMQERMENELSKGEKTGTELYCLSLSDPMLIEATNRAHEQKLWNLYGALKAEFFERLVERPHLARIAEGIAAEAGLATF